MGFRPIVLERGKAVRERTRDTWGLWRKHVLNPESNVQFGEGGAGTFSDGKLYSQIKDPKSWPQSDGRIRQAGAPEEILYVSSRISAPSGWSAWSSRCAPRSSRARRRKSASSSA